MPNFPTVSCAACVVTDQIYRLAWRGLRRLGDVRLKGPLFGYEHAEKTTFQFLHPGRNAYRDCHLGNNGTASDEPKRRFERGKTHQRARTHYPIRLLGLCMAAILDHSAGTTGSNTMYRRSAHEAAAPS